ncbi:MAG: hypothetical protein G8345_12370 [Magnetococcales bacterium]|nr:hypothetical protein [Magnetococcales bacterium]NGZ27668.1 hypothetical protein [Magnetococcales bacterium]
MTWLVWLAEKRPAWMERLLPMILSLANDHPQQPILLALASRVERNTNWLPWNAVSGGAGVRQITLTEWTPESPALRLRRQQVAPLRTGERLLGYGQVVTMEFNSLNPLPITLAMSLEEVALQPVVPFQVAVAVDEEKPRILTFFPEQRQRNHDVTLPAGRHQVQVWMEHGAVNQLLRLLVLEAGQPLVIPQERTYLVATPQEPVTVHLAGPSWLRIDEWRSGQTILRYQQSDGRQPLRLQPAPGQSEALYRIFVKQVAPQKTRSQPRWLESKPIPVPESPLVVPAVALPTEVLVTDGLPLGGQEDGTWSFAAGWQQRRNSEAKVSGAAERFVEGSATWRYYDEPARSWWQAGLLKRIREQGDSSYGLFGRIDSRPLYPPLNLFAEERLFAQELDASGMKWASRFRTGLSQWQPLDPKLGNEWKGWAFWNHQEVDSVPAWLQGKVDQDVFSSYRHDHRYGVELADTVRYRPWLDSELWAEVGLASNENFNLLDPDRLRWQAGWSQLVGPVLLKGGYTGNHYRADQDRSQSHTRQELELAIGFEQWQPDGQRLEWRLSGDRDLGDGKVRAMLELTWHESGGRGYRDFRPGEIMFREERERRSRQEPFHQDLFRTNKVEKP